MAEQKKTVCLEVTLDPFLPHSMSPLSGLTLPLSIYTQRDPGSSSFPDTRVSRFIGA
jgi:hypothetical protein